MPTVSVDVRQLSGDEDLVEAAENASISFWPYAPYHVEEGAEDYLVGGEVLGIPLIAGAATVELPETPAGNAIYVQLRGVRGYSTRWLVAIPATDVNLFDLPELDPDTLDPANDPQAAWVAYLAALQAEVDTTANTLVTLAELVDDKADDTATTAALATKQPLDADLTAIAALTPTDTQQLAWSTSLGEWTVANPTGSSLNASASNTTGTTTAFTTTVVTIPSTAISVTNSGGRSVVIDFEAEFAQTVVGTGTVWLALYETTSGAVFKRAVKRALPNLTGTNGQISIGMGRFLAGVITTTRTFELRAVLFVQTGSPAAVIGNGASTPTIIQAINQ